MPYGIVIIFLDADKHVSPFDILTAIDLYPNAHILSYSDVKAEDARKIVQDAIFPRGPEGAKHTKLFIGGSDMEEALKILEAAKGSMFPPFEISIIVDPKGGYTTASAAVAKTLEISVKKGLGELRGKTITVLASTGAVGLTATRIFAQERAKVTITSRSPERASSIAERVNEEMGDERVRGVKAHTSEEVGKAIKEAIIILAAGASGVQLLTRDILENYGKECRIVADVNAVLPSGIEGLASNADGDEIFPNVFGIGALTIGGLKNRVEAALFKQAIESPKGVFDYDKAYGIAKELVN